MWVKPKASIVTSKGHTIEGVPVELPDVEAKKLLSIARVVECDESEETQEPNAGSGNQDDDLAADIEFENKITDMDDDGFKEFIESADLETVKADTLIFIKEEWTDRFPEEEFPGDESE